MHRIIKSIKRKINHGLLKFQDDVICGFISVAYITKLPVNVKFSLINARPERPVIWVPTSSIKFFVPNKCLEEVFSPHQVTKSKIPSFLFKGEWDHKKLLIEEYYSKYNKGYRTIHQLFAEKKVFNKTDEYRILLEKINKEGRSPRGKTVDELNSYFQSLVRLETLIRQHGYKSQAELNGNEKDEIGVFIGRKGEIIKAEDNFSGTHRFALAKMLNIQKVPVHILAVHYKWAYENQQLLWPKQTDKLEKYFQN
jgi:hypothetical protein